MNKLFLTLMVVVFASCTPIILSIPPDPELPRINFLLDQSEWKAKASACLDNTALKEMYERELILKGHINILKEQIKRCN